jgi:endonuclease YncB( thermonuclease family)
VTDWTYPGTLTDAIDGDTFRAELHRTVDIGFHVEMSAVLRQKFRLNRCNTAPTNTPSGKGAAARSEELLVSGVLTITSVGPYKFGDEWMAEVILPDGRNLTDVLIAEQWAAPWNGRGTAPLPPWPRSVP